MVTTWTGDAAAGAAAGAARVLWAVGPVAAALVFGALVALDLWYVAAGMLAAATAAALVARYPLAAISLWLALGPLVAVTDSGAVRKAFWLVHRLLPVATLALVVLLPARGRARRLPPLGWPEAMMGGYVAATLLSIAYTSEARLASAYLLYDRVVAPMCLYALVRLLEPGERDLLRLAPALGVMLLGQALIGVLSWTAPEVLPTEWLGKVGDRTTGSLRSPELFSVAVLFAGLLLLHLGQSRERALARAAGVLAFLLASTMAVLSFSRSAWVAAGIATLGVLAVHRRSAGWVAAAVILVALLLPVTGALQAQVEHAQQRVRSEESDESALSRLPVALAAGRMFAAKPITGWGYENFDRYDRPFQGRVGDLFYPDKDHASHNLYLTTLAEQGVVGFVLLLGAPLYWLARSRHARRLLPATGIVSRQLLALLWVALATQVVVSSFYRMQIPFGFGLWWLGLGLVAVLLDRARPRAPRHAGAARNGTGARP